MRTPYSFVVQNVTYEELTEKYFSVQTTLIVSHKIYARNKHWRCEEIIIQYSFCEVLYLLMLLG
jgi:hypothetical protein